MSSQKGWLPKNEYEERTMALEVHAYASAKTAYSLAPFERANNLANGTIKDLTETNGSLADCCRAAIAITEERQKSADGFSEVWYADKDGRYWKELYLADEQYELRLSKREPLYPFLLDN